MPEKLEPAALDERSTELFAQLPDPSAREELVHLYYPLVEYLSRRFRSRGEPLDDLVQVASIGLLKSIDRFDVDRGVRFSTYAVPTIIGELKRHFRDTGWAMRVPRRLQERALLLRTVIGQVSQEIGRSPTVTEIAKRAGLTDEETLEAMETMHAHSLRSLDAPMDGDEESSTMQTIGAEDPAIELFERWTNVAPLLRRLPERERQLLYYRFVANMPQSQIAQKLGISQMHVSRLLSKTLTMLRSAAEETEG